MYCLQEWGQPSTHPHCLLKAGNGTQSFPLLNASHQHQPCFISPFKLILSSLNQGRFTADKLFKNVSLATSVFSFSSICIKIIINGLHLSLCAYNYYNLCIRMHPCVILAIMCNLFYCFFLLFRKASQIVCIIVL